MYERGKRLQELKVPRCGPRMLSSGGQALAGACGRHKELLVYTEYTSSSRTAMIYARIPFPYIPQ